MPKSFQIKLSEQEQVRLIQRIEDDFIFAKSAHQDRSQRFARYMQKWENRVDPPKAGAEKEPNHTVPLIQWQCFNKLARSLQSILGDDAEITAKATGPSDEADARKIGCYMTSRVFDQMGMLNPLCVFEFYRILLGRAIAYRPWFRREFNVIAKGKRKRVCDYEGPGFFPCHPDDIIVPPERGVMSIQDFSYVIRRVSVTVDDLQYGDGDLYQGTKDPEFVRQAINWAQNGAQSNDWTQPGQDPVRKETERSEGVAQDGGNQNAQRRIWLWEWYGSWRPLKKQGSDGGQDDLKRRQPFEADWVVRYIPGMKQIVGVQDLMELYPKMRRRRPFVDASLIKDGTYWSKGFGALLESLEDEATANSRLFTAAGELSVWPIIFYKPGGGFQPKAMEYGPKMAIPTEDPGGVNVVTLRANLDYAIAKQQDTLSMAERVTGITDQSLGRAVDRPNAPKTATGQLALIEEGNVRAYLDSTILKEDMEQIITDFWMMDCDLASRKDPGLFFRVTEEQAKGAFDTMKGGAYMTPKEFGGTYDFRLKFATSAWSREAQAQKQISFYQLAVRNPLVMQNPRALWVLLNDTAKALGIRDFSNVVAEPPDLDMPKTPDQEWTLMLEGDDTVNPNPQDHDDLHEMQHMKQLAEAVKSPEKDEQAINLLIRHIRQTQEQKSSKMAVAALTQSLIQSVNQPQDGSLPGQHPLMPALMAPHMGAPGDVPPPPAGVGSQAAPQAQDGML